MSKYTDNPFQIFRARSRKLLQAIPIPDTGPVTAATYGSHWERDRPRRHTTSFRVLVVPEHNSYPFTAAVSAVIGVPESVDVRRRFLRFERRLQAAEQPLFTERPFPFPSYLASSTFYRRKTSFSWQGVEQDEWPATPLTHYYPASILESAQRSGFDRKRLDTPAHDQWTVTPPPAAATDIAWADPVVAFRFKEIGQFLQPSFLSAFKKTDPAYYEGWYPGGFATERAHKVWFERRHLREPLDNAFPVTPAPTDKSQIATVLEFVHRRHEKRRRLDVPEHNEWAQPFVAHSAVLIEKAILRQRLKRRLRLVPLHDQWTATPVSPIGEQYPGFMLEGMHRRHESRHLRLVLPYNNWKAFEPPTSGNPLIVEAENTTMIVNKESTTMIVPKENTTLVA